MKMRDQLNIVQGALEIIMGLNDIRNARSVAESSLKAISPNQRSFTSAEMLKTRRVLGLTQEELAAILGYSRVHIAHIERGYRPMGKKITQKLRDYTVLMGKTPKSDGLVTSDKAK